MFEVKEVYGYTEWSCLRYKGKNREEYDVFVVRTYKKEEGVEKVEIQSIEYNGSIIPKGDFIYKEVRLALKKSPRRSWNSEQGHSKT